MLEVEGIREETQEQLILESYNLASLGQREEMAACLITEARGKPILMRGCLCKWSGES